MNKYKNFTLDTKNNHELWVYVRRISSAFGQGSKIDKHIFGNSKLENGYDLLVLNHRILKSDFYLDIDFILGGCREYLKLSCDVFAESEDKINDIKKELEEICEV